MNELRGSKTRFQLNLVSGKSPSSNPRKSADHQCPASKRPDARKAQSSEKNHKADCQGCGWVSLIGLCPTCGNSGVFVNGSEERPGRVFELGTETKAPWLLFAGRMECLCCVFKILGCFKQLCQLRAKRNVPAQSLRATKQNIDQSVLMEDAHTEASSSVAVYHEQTSGNLKKRKQAIGM